MVSDLVENLTRDVMLDLAGERYFERGEAYHRGGHVYELVEATATSAGNAVGPVVCWPRRSASGRLSSFPGSAWPPSPRSSGERPCSPSDIALHCVSTRAALAPLRATAKQRPTSIVVHLVQRAA